MEQTLDKGVLVCVGLGAILLVLNAGVATRNTRQLLDDTGEVAHTHEVLDLSSDVLRTLVDAEAGQRGFLITGKKSFLDPYHQALSRLDEQVRALKDKTQDNPHHQARIKELKKLSAERLALLKQAIDLRRKGAAEAQAFVATGQGKKKMDAIRRLIAAMEAEEHGLLQDRQRQSAVTYRTAVTAEVIAAAEGLAFVGAVLYFVRRMLRERNRAAVLVHEERERLHTTLTSIGDAVIVTDTGGRVTLMNRVAESLTGWGQEQAQGQPLEAVFPILHERTRQPVANPVVKVIREGVVVGMGNHTVLLARDGSERPIDDTAAPIKDGQGATVGVVLTFRDVTEQRQAQVALRQSEARKTAILETALDGIITIDHEGKVVEFNPAAEEVFGYRRADMLGREMAELIVPPPLREQHRRGLAHYLATGEGPVLNKRLEMPALRADGKEFPAELAITRILTEGPPTFTAYVRDITEQKRTERRRNARLAVTQILAQSLTLRDAAPGILRAVCEGLSWDVGLLWVLDPQDKVLRCHAIWHSPSPQVEGFERVSRESTFRAGVGLPGRVWASGQPAWIPDVGQDANFPRAPVARREGLHGAFGCPVLLGTEVIGVIEFFSHEIRKPDADLLEMMATVGGQLGQFIERRRAEEFHQAVMANLGEGLYAVDTQGLVTYLNPAAEALFGWTSAELLGRKMHDITHYKHPDGNPFPAEECAGLQVLRQGKVLRDYDDVFIKKDGSFFPVVYSSSPLAWQGKIVGLVVVFRDVTERKRAEQATRFLADASKWLAALVDHSSTMQKVARMAAAFFADWCTVDMVEADGSVSRIAMAHADPAKAAWTHELERCYPPDSTTPFGLPNVLRTGQAEMLADIPDLEAAASDQDQQHLRCLRELGVKSLMCVPVAARGQTIAVLTFVSAGLSRRYDAADLTLAEDLAHRASIAMENARLYNEVREADHRKDEFLAMLAHELRNPLAPIRNALHIMKQPGVSGALVERVREMMERQVQHMTRMVDDLLDVSRITRGKIELRKEVVDLASVVNRTVEATRPLIEDRHQELTVDLPPEPLRLEADPTRLEQVLANLLNNAAKYTDHGGQIWLSARQEGGELVLRVRDTGVGISADMLARIFEPFVQSDRILHHSQGGLGIGLTLVGRLVEMHGGTVTAHSEGPGKGSEFIVRLPALSPKQPIPGPRMADEGSEPVGAGPQCRILVVDDNVDAAESLALLLRMEGHDVRVAYDGPAALAAVEADPPDLVFLDIGMPVMNGYDVAQQLRQRPALEHLLLVAVTGWGQEEDRHRSQEAGFDHHLVKPVEPDALHQLLAGAKARSP